jgi:hypothetical protein
MEHVVKADVKNQILHAVGLVLRPLIALLIRYGIGLNEMMETVKRLYVEEARRALDASEKKVTESALSVMSGVHRKDVHRFELEREQAGSVKLEKRSPLDTVITVWTSDPRFLNKRGEPRPLARRKFGKDAPPSPLATFEDLVETVSKGVPPKSVLDEWLRLGAVTLDALDQVVYATPEYAAGNELGQIKRSMLVSSDRLRAVVQNIAAGKQFHPTSFVRGYRLSETEAATLEEKVKPQIQAFATEMNRLIVQAEKRSAKQGDTSMRYSIGVHAFYDTMENLHAMGLNEI